MALEALLPTSFSTSYLWPSLLILIVLSPIFTLIYDITLWRSMPPGPRPLPFIGNKYQLPKSQPWHQFAAWGKEYGPIFTLWIGRRPTVVISDPVVAAELMEKRSNKYSSRPRMVAMGELLWEGGSILVQPYGKAWTARRKLLHQALTPKALRLYKPVQEAEAARLNAQLLDTPANFEKLIERFTSSVVFCVAYGHRIDSLHAEVIRQRFEFMQYSASLNVPGKYMVETFPLLKHIPTILAPWKADIKAHGRREAAANMALVDVVRNDMSRAAAAGKPSTVPDSLCKMLLELRAQGTDIPLSDRDFSFIPASLFGAGSDTTASTLCTALLALITHPAALHAAHAELDAVVGDARTPRFSDEPSLPYVRALVKETLRWRPVAVLGGTPHASTEDDVFDGRRIPAGTTVLANSWAINLNPDYYPDPHRFEPLRFHDDPRARPPALGGAKAHPAKAGHSSFGWGRRICPGADLAANSLFVALAKVLWAFDVLPAEGVVYDTFAYTDGFNIRPRKFECVIRARSEAHAAVVRREAVEAMEVLGRFEPFGEGGKGEA
ncbi:putative cytochrome p450 protein [Neofusicoccum parvum]|uniref:Cytochrome p450 protein n=1 Tax=Neofusicoccum parvum TaxID=310453 RepID=A0ACB5RQP5_9PEZI|nr:putative cytochrome p450 protein [Neofusicoccum parvum]GME45500.1 putative cytochrome p450 protein [Neofusicoccum parvum]